MGMSASQARLLQLQARQSNLEYQGQQINQERTILSQQCTDLYNSLLGMTVPTPPSTQDYTTVQYTGTDGASTFTLGNITPNGNNTYNVDLKYKKTGHYMESAGTALVENVPPYIYVTGVNAAGKTEPNAIKRPDSTVGKEVADGTSIMVPTDANHSLEDGEQFYELKKDKNGNAYFVPIDKAAAKSVKQGDLYLKTTAKNKTTEEANYNVATAYDLTGVGNSEFSYGGISASQIQNYFVMDNSGNSICNATISDFTQLADGTYKFTGEGTLVEKTTDGSGSQVKNPDSTNSDITHYVEGNPCMSVASAKAALGTSYDSYIEAIRDAFPEMAEKSDDDIANLFSVYFTKSAGSTTQVPNFVLTSDLTSNTTNVNGHSYVEHYNYMANGSYTSSEPKEDCQLTFDTSGRITEIKFPTAYNADGTPKSYKTVSLEASTTTDEAAYQDAYNKYEYAMYEYDKKQQEINAKTEIIQQEDRNLELKLQRLDNERRQITTEIEAVEKVIDDNIESSYKTFSG